jgi:hypothetical protein
MEIPARFKKNVLPLEKYLRHNPDLCIVYKQVDPYFGSAVIPLPELRLYYTLNKWTCTVTPAGIYCYANIQDALRTNPRVILVCLALKHECIQKHGVVSAGEILGDNIQCIRKGYEGITSFCSSQKHSSITYDELFIGILHPAHISKCKRDDWLFVAPLGTITYRRVLPIAFLDSPRNMLSINLTYPPIPRDMIPVVSCDDLPV